MLPTCDLKFDTLLKYGLQGSNLNKQFRWKTLCKDSFPYLVASEKISKRKIIFSQHKKYGLFLEIVFH